MKLFSSYNADRAYDRWLDPPDLHEDDNCRECHRVHVMDNLVFTNAKEDPRRFTCCVEAIENGFKEEED